MGRNRQLCPTSPTDLAQAPSQAPAKVARMSGLSARRRVLLGSASHFAMTVSGHSLRLLNTRRLLNTKSLSAPTHAPYVLAPFLWAMQWILRFALCGFSPKFKTESELVSLPNPGSRTFRRHIQGLSKKHGYAVHIRAPYLLGLLCRGLSHTQRCEVLARFSILGRVRTYGMVHCANVLEHLFRTFRRQYAWPMPYASKLNSGLWDVQLPPS